MTSLYGRGVGRSKKEAEQGAAETAYGEIHAPSPPTPEACAVPELPEVEVVRAGLERHVLRRRVVIGVEVLHPRPVRRDPRGPAGFAAALAGRRIEAVRRRGKYLWLALDNGDALLGHLGMSGQMLAAAARALPTSGTCGCGSSLGAGRPLRDCASSTSGCSGACWSPRAAPTCPPRSRTSPATRSTRSSTTTTFAAPRAPAYLRDQAAAAGPDPGLRGRQHLRRRGAVARRAARRPAGGPAHPGAGAASVLGQARAVMTEALGAGRDVLRRALRQRQRRVRLLRPLAARLRPRGRAVRPVRYADPADRLHEPLVVLLPRLPAATATRWSERPPRFDPGDGSVGLLKTARSGHHHQIPEGSVHGQGADRLPEQRPARPPPDSPPTTRGCGRA